MCNWRILNRINIEFSRQYIDKHILKLIIFLKALINVIKNKKKEKKKRNKDNSNNDNNKTIEKLNKTFLTKIVWRLQFPQAK